MRGGPEDPAPGGEEGGVGAESELLELVVAVTGEHPTLQESERKGMWMKFIMKTMPMHYMEPEHVDQATRHQGPLTSSALKAAGMLNLEGTCSCTPVLGCLYSSKSLLQHLRPALHFFLLQADTNLSNLAVL